MTLETANAYFQQSDVVQAAKEKERGTRTLPSRVDSFAGHLSDATSDISSMKKALWTLSQMVLIIDTKIDALTPTGDSQESCASQKSVSALMGAMRVATATIEDSAAAAAAAAATAAATPVPSPKTPKTSPAAEDSAAAAAVAVAFECAGACANAGDGGDDDDDDDMPPS